MIKISCNEEESRRLLKSMANSEECPLGGSECFQIGYVRSCVECLKERIEWDIMEDTLS